MLVLISNFAAWPAAYLAMREWLNNFSYRIDVGIEWFILSGFIAFIITLVTVSYRSVKAAMANPVYTLRYE
jgi:putative ABC transport system permease protein